MCEKNHPGGQKSTCRDIIFAGFIRLTLVKLLGAISDPRITNELYEIRSSQNLNSFDILRVWGAVGVSPIAAGCPLDPGVRFRI